MVRQDWSDDDLTQRLREHDHEALETLISRYSREMLYFIRMVLDRVGAMQDAEECLYDLFMAVWNEIDTFDPGRGTLRTWITMRAKFIALDRRRQLMRRQTHHWQPADETRQWNSSDTNGSRSLSGWRGYEQENRATLPPHPESSMEALMEQSERREELRLALATLPELDRRLIILRYFKYVSTEELAAQ